MLPTPDWLIPPPPVLADCVQHALVKTLPASPYYLPAGLHPIFLLILSGGIVLHHGGVDRRLPRLSLAGGTRGIRHATSLPGTRILTLSLQPGSLRRLLPLPPVAVMEELVPLVDLVSGPAREALYRYEDAQAGMTDEAQQIGTLFGLLAEWRQQVRRCSSVTDLIVPPDWLHRPVAELADAYGIGQRQFERRFRQSYGQPLKSYRRQARSSQLVTQLLFTPTPQRPWQTLADLAALAGFYDQAHLNHDLLTFTGHTPTALLTGMAGNDPFFWPYQLDGLHLHRLFGPTGF